MSDEKKVLKVRFQMNTGFVGAVHEDVFDLHVPKEATEAEIERIIQEEYDQWMYEQIDCTWRIL